MEVKTSSTVFVEIEPTKPLEDKRRLRVRSIGRPPSQLFIKESILQRSESMDNQSGETEEDESKVSSVRITSMSQLVQEIQQRTGLNTASTGKQARVSLQKPPLLRKVTPPLPVGKPEGITVAPWMQEMQKKRKHKLSFQGDETLQKEGNAIRYVAGEISNYSEMITQETHNKTTSITQLKTEVDTCNTSQLTTATKVVKNYTLAENDATTVVEKTVKQDLNKMEPPIEDRNNTTSNKKNSIILTTEGNADRTNVEVNKAVEFVQKQNPAIEIKSEKTPVIKDGQNFQNKKATFIQTATLAAKTEKYVKEPSTKVAMTPANVTPLLVQDREVQLKKEALLEEPIESMSIKRRIKDGETVNKNGNIINTPCEQTVSPTSQRITKEDNFNSLRLVLDEVEDFAAKHRTRSKEIRKHIEKVQKDVDQQRKEMKIFVESVKAKLLAFIQDECNA